MASDPTLKFDHRTPVDLKDKYRNMLKKGLINGTPLFASTLPKRKPGNQDPSDFVDEPPRPVSAIEQPPPRTVLPTVKGIIKRDAGWSCLMSMEEVGERLVPMEDIPANLLPSFKAYRKHLKRQLRLTRETMLMLSTRGKKVKGGARIRREGRKELDDDTIEQGQNNQQKDEHGQDNNGERHSEGEHRDEASNPGTSKDINLVPLQIVDQGNPEEAIREQQEPIRVKRTRLVSKMREARQSPDGKSCLVQ